jgi:hypothetical protein
MRIKSVYHKLIIDLSIMDNLRFWHRFCDVNEMHLNNYKYTIAGNHKNLYGKPVCPLGTFNYKLLTIKDTDFQYCVQSARWQKRIYDLRLRKDTTLHV